MFPTYHDDFFEPMEPHNRYHFITNVQKIKDKLMVLGYTIKSAEKEFEVNRLILLAEAITKQEKYDNESHTIPRVGMTIQFLKDLNYTDFINYIVKKTQNRFDEFNHKDKLLSSIEIEAFFKYDVRYLFRIYLEYYETNDRFAYDITEQHHLWFSDEMDELNNPYDYYTSDIFTQIEIGFRKKLIILTEGKSDVACLSQSLDLLFPHLKRYYGFLDYTVSGTGLGGASSTVKFLKSLIAAGASDYYIAVFDNDLAGREAIESIGKILPYNFRAIQYPSIKLLENYPVAGPSGVSTSDINGLGGSLEMYFGRDVLEKNGSLKLAKWTGYNSKYKLYQASLINKSIVQEKFYKKLKKGIKNNSEKDLFWNDMIELLYNIFSAFEHPFYFEQSEDSK